MDKEDWAIASWTSVAIYTDSEPVWSCEHNFPPKEDKLLERWPVRKMLIALGYESMNLHCPPPVYLNTWVWHTA